MRDEVDVALQFEVPEKRGAGHLGRPGTRNPTGWCFQCATGYLATEGHEHTRGPRKPRKTGTVRTA